MNRRIMAARAAQNPTITGTFGRVMPPTPVSPNPGAIRSTRARMTGAQRNSQGRVSEWNRSPFAPKGGWR